MKFSILALGAAVAGISSQCVAQLHIESSFPSRPEARLVSQQEPVGSAQASEPAFTNDDSPYFAPTPPQAELTRDQLRNSQSILGEEPVVQEEASAEEAATPTGKPVKKPVAAAPMHVLAMTPEVGMVPVCWQSAGGCPTPNPIAQYMTESWCTNGLWDGYACQRARQCAHIQKHLFGHNRYTCGGCATCGMGHHGHTAAAGCSSCAASTSQCAQNSANITSDKQGNLPAQSLLASTPAPQSPYLGESQAGLPVVDVDQILRNMAQQPMGQPAQLTTAPASNRLPNGQPLLQLPADVPTVPSNPMPPMPQIPSVLPALPVPSANPVVASRPSASLR